MSTISERRIQWDEFRNIIDATTDKLGMPIDTGIRELIVALNVYGLKTTMSCIGHIRENKTLAIEDFVITPYVFIKPPLDKKLEEELEERRQKVSDARNKNNKEEHRKAYKEWQFFKDKVSSPYYMCLNQLIGLFAEFYKDRSVAYDAQLYARGSLMRVTIKNIGENCLYLMNLNNKKEKLKEYQGEFISFGEFLKGKYFDENPNN